MVSAIYYPFTQIRNASLIRTALLLWDNIEYIVPHHQFRNRPISNKMYQRALELVARARVPSTEEKQSARDNIVSFVDRGLPKSFYVSEPANKDYSIYIEKFDRPTWELLKGKRLATSSPGDSEFRVSQSLGLLMMSALADARAGSQILKVTDRETPYAWLSENLTEKLGGQYAPGLSPSQIAPTCDRLVTLSVKMLDSGQISLKSLLAMREREMKERGNDLQSFRHRYLKAVNDWVNKLSTEAKTRNDTIEIERQFQLSMKDDLADLRSELGLSRNKALFSKEVGVMAMAIAVAGALAAPVAAIATLSTALKSIGVGALIKTGVEYKAARRKALRDHSMSWLFQARKRDFF